MDREKILAFLNLEVDRPIDKFLMKTFTWCYVAIVLFTFSSGFAFHFIDMSWISLAVLVFSACTSILFFLSIHFIKNPLWVSSLCITILFCSVLISLYGWHEISEGERLHKGCPEFTWIHLAILCFAFSLGFYVFLKTLRMYRLLKTHTVEQARFEVQKKTRGWLVLPLCGCPMGLVFALKGFMHAMGLGMGVGLWGFACIGHSFILMMLLHPIVIFKYKVYQWFTVPSDVKKD